MPTLTVVTTNDYPLMGLHHGDSLFFPELRLDCLPSAFKEAKRLADTKGIVLGYQEIPAGLLVHRVEPGNPRTKYPFADMEPGDSVFYPGQRHLRSKGDPQGIARAATAARTYACRTKKRFAAHQEPGGVYITRLPDELPPGAGDLFD